MLGHLPEVASQQAYRQAGMQKRAVLQAVTAFTSTINYVYLLEMSRLIVRLQASISFRDQLASLGDNTQEHHRSTPEKAASRSLRNVLACSVDKGVLDSMHSLC